MLEIETQDQDAHTRVHIVVSVDLRWRIFGPRSSFGFWVGTHTDAHTDTHTLEYIVMTVLQV